jgi:hypothetical protein
MGNVGAGNAVEVSVCAKYVNINVDMNISLKQEHRY